MCTYICTHTHIQIFFYILLSLLITLFSYFYVKDTKNFCLSDKNDAVDKNGTVDNIVENSTKRKLDDESLKLLQNKRRKRTGMLKSVIY